MKFLLPLIVLCTLGANEITLTKQQAQNWQIQTTLASPSGTIPLGTFMIEVVTPPHLLQAITLPFEAQITKLHIASFQEIKQGEILAEISSPSWIEAQQTFISHTLMHNEQKSIAHRKNRLCKEGIIPQKECISINTTLQNTKSKQEAAKALLLAYGASQKQITQISQTKHIQQYLPIYANKSGIITHLNTEVGSSIDTSKPLCIIQKPGALWMESDLPQKYIKTLQKQKSLFITLNGSQYQCNVLNFSPTINRQNQTQRVRFSLPKNAPLLAGFRGISEIIINKPSWKIAQKSVIQSENQSIVFVKKDHGYQSLAVNIYATQDPFYYIEKDEKLKAPIVISGIAILKSMMETENE
ncbi:MAG: efflux RND transporter periplasmic adaptor subunit [Epsilonproteobacteria bacterium]|nr:efflux RND transporter periplasmic adaptor subunit [Campylobacterota bacterium]